MAIDWLLAKLAQDASEYGPRALDTHVEQLGALVESGRGPTPTEAERLLKQLRDCRCFATMLDVAELLEGELSGRSRIYQVQALIDRDRLVPAGIKLKRILADLEQGRLDDDFAPRERDRAKRELRSEILGLFGRLHKQRFVSAYLRGDDDPAEHLRLAMQYYQDVYELDPAWHGANLAALAWRAAREGYDLGELPAADAIGSRLEAEPALQGDVALLGPWLVSARAQARMAQNDWETGLVLYGAYIRKLERLIGGGAAFMLMGDLRQLREIWQIGEEGAGPRKRIVQALAHGILAHPEGRVTLSLEEIGNLQRDDEPGPGRDRLEAIVNPASTILATRVVENLRLYLKAICKIHGRPGLGRERAVGSGFLVCGQAIGLPKREPVLVTNAHVISKTTKYLASTLFCEEAAASFEAWNAADSQRAVPIREVLWESPPEDCDVAVCRVGPLSEEAALVQVTRRQNPYPLPDNDPRQHLGTVVPIGYPGGRELSYSFGSNPILDHDLHRDPGSPRVVHYKADTEPGSSGCPIFDRSGAVVAIHRKFTETRIRGSAKTHAGSYAANEGIGLHAARRACLHAARRKSR